MEIRTRAIVMDSLQWTMGKSKHLMHRIKPEKTFQGIDWN